MNSNQKCLIAISVILNLVTLLITVMLVIEEKNLSEVTGAIPFVIIFSIPALIAVSGQKKRRRSRTSGKRPQYVTATAPPSPSYSKVDIFAGEELPPLCTTCGQKTGRTTRLDFEARNSTTNKYGLSHVNPFLAIFIIVKLTAVAILTAIYVKFEQLWGSLKSNQHTLTFGVPQCSSCSKKYPVHRYHLDYHGRMMTIFARNDLAEAIHAKRSSDKSS